MTRTRIRHIRVSLNKIMVLTRWVGLENDSNICQWPFFYFLVKNHSQKSSELRSSNPSNIADKSNPKHTEYSLKTSECQQWNQILTIVRSSRSLMSFAWRLKPADFTEVFC
jgi:hypothetical protein